MLVAFNLESACMCPTITISMSLAPCSTHLTSATLATKQSLGYMHSRTTAACHGFAQNAFGPLCNGHDLRSHHAAQTLGPRAATVAPCTINCRHVSAGTDGSDGTYVTCCKATGGGTLTTAHQASNLHRRRDEILVENSYLLPLCTQCSHLSHPTPTQIAL